MEDAKKETTSTKTRKFFNQMAESAQSVEKFTGGRDIGDLLKVFRDAQQKGVAKDILQSIGMVSGELVARLQSDEYLVGVSGQGCILTGGGNTPEEFCYWYSHQSSDERIFFGSYFDFEPHPEGIVCKKDDGLYLNDKKILSFPDDQADVENLEVNPDGSVFCVPTWHSSVTSPEELRGGRGYLYLPQRHEWIPVFMQPEYRKKDVAIISWAGIETIDGYHATSWIKGTRQEFYINLRHVLSLPSKNCRGYGVCSRGLVVRLPKQVYLDDKPVCDTEKDAVITICHDGFILKEGDRFTFNKGMGNERILYLGPVEDHYVGAGSNDLYVVVVNVEGDREVRKISTVT